MANSHRVMKILTASILSGSVATIVLSIYAALVTGYHYGALTSFRTYNGILTGSAFILAIVLLAGFLTVHRVDASSQQILKSVRNVVQSETGWTVSNSRVKEAVGEVLQQAPNSPKAEWLRQTVEEYEDLQRFRRDMKHLLAAPVGLLSAIFAISAWALPATEAFLQGFYYVNTALLFFVTYGMVVAVASVIAAALVMLTARPATAP
ncbi:MAG: hypothetical protein ACE5HJ_05715 [Thermoplasmata archaeon]